MSSRGGNGRGSSRGGPSRGGPSRGRGGSDRGNSRPERDDRPPKEPFKAKEGFIAAGLKAYTETAEAASAKAKEEITEGWKDKTTTQTTLHLTNLPASLSSPQLSLIMSSYAPLRSAFVVSAGSNASAGPGGAGVNAIKAGASERSGKFNQSRGFGYVRFVLRTDAEKCLVEWGGAGGIGRASLSGIENVEGAEGIEFDKICGRNGIKMGWAKKKLKEGEEPEGGIKVKKEKKPREDKVVKEKKEWIDYDAEDAPERPRQTGGFDRQSSRTVIVQGLTIPLTPEQIEAIKIKKAETMEVDTEKEPEKDDVIEDEEMEETGEKEEKTGEDEESAPGKEIDWKKALKIKTKKFGDVEEINWPVVLPSGETVATIVLPSPRLAHAMMQKLNNHVFKGVLISACVKSSWDLVEKLGRGKGGGRLVVRNLGFEVTIPDLRSIFSKFGSLHSITLPLSPAPELKPRGFAFVYYLSKTVAETALAAVNGTRIYSGMEKERVESEGGKGGKKSEIRKKKDQAEKADGGGGGERGRLVAVDWAVGKDEFKRAQVEEVKADAIAGSEEESDEEDEEKDENEDSDMSPVPEGAEEEEEEEVRHADDDDDELDEEPKGPEPPKGTTLFVRNMSFEATESELYDLFKAFGPVRYARIVFDPTTKRSRGTAFVCFWNDEDARKVLMESEILNAGLYGETSQKNGKATAHSLLMADPTSSTAGRLSLHGRVLAAVEAVSKGDADGLREDRDKKGAAKTDRRNLYLMREGVIFPSWAIAQTLHPADIQARQASFDARKGLLRSNPSLYISRSRLSVRQIPLYVSDGMMKRLANYAMKEFEKEVKLGNQKPLTAEELAGNVLDAGMGGELPATVAERIRGVPPSRVRQAKILRQADRVDPLTGMGRSKGYGFLELGCHADALRVLRWCNANKEVGALYRGWWRETLEKMIEKVENGESIGGIPSTKKISDKEKEERLKRLREKMEDLVEEEEIAAGKAAKAKSKGKTVGEGGRSSKCLIVEFSIENAVTTKRRAEKADRARDRAKKSRANDSGEESEVDMDLAATSTSKSRRTLKRKGEAEGEEDEMAKKIKIANSTKAELADSDEAAENDDGKANKLNIGSIIGRKRKKGKGN